tara:strand:- start:48 stop:392 length:345 start_codon:yes stop_codon:yes gene_type:complete
MKSYEWIVRVKDELELPSDNKAAMLIGVTRSAVSHHKSGKLKQLKDEHCMKVAELLGINPAEVIADQHAEGADNPALKSVWQSMAKNLSQSAAVFSIFATLLAGSLSSPQIYIM